MADQSLSKIISASGIKNRHSQPVILSLNLITDPIETSPYSLFQEIKQRIIVSDVKRIVDARIKIPLIRTAKEIFTDRWTSCSVWTINSFMYAFFQFI